MIHCVLFGAAKVIIFFGIVEVRLETAALLDVRCENAALIDRNETASLLDVRYEIAALLDRKCKIDFEKKVNNGNKPELNNPVPKTNTIDEQPTKDLFEFIPLEQNPPNFDWGLFSLLSDAQDVDYEEEQSAKRMKK